MDLIGTRNLRDLLDERTVRSPDKAFIVFEDSKGTVTELTYREFSDKVDRLANGMTDLGVKQYDKVAVHLSNSPEILLSWFALATLGAVMVPSNTANTAAELGYVLDNSDSVAVITEPRFLDTVSRARSQAITVQHLIVARADEVSDSQISFDGLTRSPAEPAVRPHVDSEDVVEMIFTSGTTARPKGVLLTHANALHSAERESRCQFLDANDRCMTALPVFHVNAQSITVLATLNVGGTCILIEEYSASRFWEQIHRHQATQTSLVAMQARTLLAQPPKVTDSQHHLRRVFYALNITLDERNEFERRFGVELLNGYGLSEAMTLVLFVPVFGPKKWPSLGLPLPDREVRLIDEDGRDVAVGEVGEIVVRGVPGRTIMKGYHNNERATAKAVRDGWLHTGDKATIDEDGYFYWFDRSKDMIKRAGENISTVEVEFVLTSHPDIEEAAVIGVPDPIRDEMVKAFVVPRPGATVDIAEVTAYCRERLASFKIPTLIEIREALPKTSIGKISKATLREQSGV